MSIGFLKLMAVVALIVILLGKKVHLFYSMILAAVILGYLFGMDTLSIVQVVSKVPISSDVIIFPTFADKKPKILFMAYCGNSRCLLFASFQV